MLAIAYRFHGHNSLRPVYQKGKALRSAHIKLLWQQSGRTAPRVAVVVSKKVHKSAVVRNRIRRRIYEQMRGVLQGTPPAIDFVFIVQDTAPAEVSHDELVAEVTGLLQKTPIQHR